MGLETMSSLGGDGGGGHLLRQGSSVYGLTLTEVEDHLGEPLRSMNLDELLRTVLPAAAAGASKKTVDEVWRDIERDSRHSTMGEMTLEGFLSLAGVPVDGSAHWLLHRQYHPPPPPQHALDDGGFLSQMSGRKRGAEDGVVEQRQKRMIKNRESAARSRARKQAYTAELENKVRALEAQIKRLNDEKKQNLNLNTEVVYVPQVAEPRDMRRISSAFF